ncbi:MAG: hypothetical protein ABIE74_05085 [Pseudomonadota bacterium]
MRVKRVTKLLIGVALLLIASGCGDVCDKDGECIFTDPPDNDYVVFQQRDDPPPSIVPATLPVESDSRDSDVDETNFPKKLNSPIGTYEVVYNQCSKDVINQCDYSAHNNLVWLIDEDNNDKLTFYPFNDYSNVKDYDLFRFGDTVTSCEARIGRKYINGVEHFVIEGECFETSGFSCTFEFIQITSDILARDGIACGANNNQP